MVFQPTEQQQAVIQHEEGPVLVIAGPGAGKTFHWHYKRGRVTLKKQAAALPKCFQKAYYESTHGAHHAEITPPVRHELQEPVLGSGYGCLPAQELCPR